MPHPASENYTRRLFTATRQPIPFDMSEPDAYLIRKVLLSKLRDAGEHRPPRALPGLETQAAQLQAFVDSVETSAGNNSLLVVGRNGSGRRSMVRMALSRVRGNKVVLWLNGTALSDDSKALREISRQLAIDTSGTGLDGFGDGTEEEGGGGSTSDEGASELPPEDEGSISGMAGNSADARLRRSILARCPELIAAAHSAARAGLKSGGAATHTSEEHAAAALSSSAGDTLPASAFVIDTAPSVAAAAASAAPQASALLSRVLDNVVALFPRPSRVWAPEGGLPEERAAAGGGAAAGTRGGGAAEAAGLGSPSAALGSGGGPRKRRGEAAKGGADAAGASAVQAPAVHRPVMHDGRQVRAGGFEHHLAFVVASLREACRGGVPVFVIIDAFDAFVSRPRQTLLYSLLDLTQARDVHVAVVGVSQAAGVLYRLEKRLRSRFSHQRVIFPGALPRAAAARALSDALSLPSAADPADPGLSAWSAESAAAWHTSVRTAAADPRVRDLLDTALSLGAPVEALKRWLEVAILSIPIDAAAAAAAGASPTPAPRLILTADALLAAARPAMLLGRDAESLGGSAAVGGGGSLLLDADEDVSTGEPPSRKPASASAAVEATPEAAAGRVVASSGPRAALLAMLSVPEIIMLAAVAHGELRHASSAGEGYLQGAGSAPGGVAGGAAAGGGDGAALQPAPAQFCMTFEGAFQAVSAHFGETLTSSSRREKASAAAAAAASGGAAAAAAARAAAVTAASATSPRAAAPKKDGSGTTVEGERAALRALAAVGVDARWQLSRRTALAAFESLLSLDLLRFAGALALTLGGGGGGAGSGAGLSLRSRGGGGGGGSGGLRMSGPSVAVEHSAAGGSAHGGPPLAAIGSPARDLIGPGRGALLACAPVCLMVEPRAVAEAARAGILRALAPFPDLARWVERGGDGVH